MYDESKIAEDQITVVVQVNGKQRHHRALQARR
jgi:hypothetical protein